MLHKRDLFLARITSSLPRILFTAVREELDGAFVEACRRSRDETRYGNPERPEVLGRERHWCAEQAMRRAAGACGLECFTSDTKPKGGKFTIIKTDDFIIGRAKVSHQYDHVHPSKYRRVLATLNAAAAWQGDLWIQNPPANDTMLYGLFIAGANRHQPEVPAFLNFAVPNSTLTAWLFNEPIESVIAAYAVEERPVEKVLDIARPRLKKLDADS